MIVDRVVLISLTRRKDRTDRAMAELAKMRAVWGQAEIFAAIDGVKLPMPNGWNAGPGAWGCMLSHRAVLQAAILDEINSLLICEDDIHVLGGAVERWDSLKIPDDWEGLMIGGQHGLRPTPVSPGIERVFNCARTHCYAVRGRYLRGLYQHLMSTTGHCDSRMSDIQHRYRVYSFNPWLAAQAPGKSDISGRVEPLRQW